MLLLFQEGHYIFCSFSVLPILQDVGVKLKLNARFGIIHSTVLLVSVYCCSMANGLPTHTYKLYNSMYMLQLYCIVYIYIHNMLCCVMIDMLNSMHICAG